MSHGEVTCMSLHAVFLSCAIYLKVHRTTNNTEKAVRKPKKAWGLDIRLFFNLNQTLLNYSANSETVNDNYGQH